MAGTAPSEGPDSRNSDRRPGLGRFGRWAILLYATLLLALGWSYGAWRIHEDRLLTLETSHQQLATLSKSLASQVQAMFADGVGAARAGAGVIHAMPAADAQRLLALMMTGGQYVRALFVMGGERLTIANAPGETYARDTMPWLDEMRASGQDVWVGQIMQRADGQELVVPIARATAGAGGATEWAGALLRFSDLVPVYADLLRSATSVSIVTDDDRVLLQMPQMNLTNAVISNAAVVRQFRAMPAQPLTMLVGPNPMTGVPRQFAVAQIDGVPMAATGGRDIDDALAEWRNRRATSVQFFLVTTVVVYALAFALQSVLNRRFFALERSEERYELAAAAANDGLFEREASGGDVYLTPRALEMLKLPRAGNVLPNERLRALVHPDDLPAVDAAFRRLEEERSRVDLEARLRTGTDYRWFRIRAQATWNEAGVSVRLAGAISDIHDAVMAQAAVSEARQAELQAKESLARELLAAQEQERNRLAAELHDGIGQLLSLLRNRAVMLQRSELPAASRDDVQALIDLARDSIEDLRRVAQNLRPLRLEELGIVAALRALIERFRQGTDIHVHSRLEDIDDVIRGEVATQVYRIVQEATNNVLKHAGARNLWIEAIRDIDCVLMRVRDDGAGIVVGPAGVGLGMFSMRERARILQAQLEVRSAAGGGTELVLRIPIETEQVAAGAEGGGQ